MNKNSYLFDKFRNPEYEARLLEVRAAKDIQFLIPTLKSFGLKKDMRVLDVGSGTGTRALEIAKFVNGGEVLGIDTSNELLRIATNKLNQSNKKNISFLGADIMSINTLSALGKFDFAHIRLVIQHLRNPMKAIKNISNILQPNGIIFLEDVDRDWMEVVPTPTSWRNLYSLIKKAQKTRGGDPNSGRKLGLYLAAAGFKEVQVKLVPVAGANSMVEEWLYNYAPSFLNHLENRQALKAFKVLQKMKEQCNRQPMFFYQTWFQASGIKKK